MEKEDKKLKENVTSKTKEPEKVKITKKKNKKNITNGIAFVNATFNNTIVSISDNSGNVIAWSSAGSNGFKGSRKSTPYAAQIAADAAASKAFPYAPSPASQIFLAISLALSVLFLSSLLSFFLEPIC